MLVSETQLPTATSECSYRDTSLFRSTPSVLSQPCKRRTRGNNIMRFPTDNVIRPVENLSLDSQDVCKILDGCLNKRDRLLKKRHENTTPTTRN
jgi:hypothetical protein